jgi:hypothetical protein
MLASFMLGSQTNVVKRSPRAFESLRGRLLAAIAAGAGLAHGCGGRAQDVANEDAEQPSRAGSSAREREPSTGRAGAPSTPGRTPPVSPPRDEPEPGPRDGELCYSPTNIAEATGVGNLLQFLPADAIDENGCLASDYSQWLDGGACNYDPRPAVFRGNRCCHLLDSSLPACGRPFVVGDAARTAPLLPGSAWTETGAGRAPHGLAPTLAREIGLEWLADAQLEHASIAAFASFSLSLLAVGAPAELVAACQRAGLDEVEHARGTFDLASRFTGETLSPGPLSLAGLAIDTDLEALVLRTWLDGCVEETLAALVAAAQLDGARDEGVRAVLTRIAADEARHAELAWSFVSWALASGGPQIRRALVAARRELAGETRCYSEEPRRVSTDVEEVPNAEMPFWAGFAAPLTRAAGAGEPGPDLGHEALACHRALGVAAFDAPAEAASLAERHAHGRLSAAELRNLRARACHDVIGPALDALLEPGSERAAPPSHGSALSA